MHKNASSRFLTALVGSCHFLSVLRVTGPREMDVVLNAVRAYYYLFTTSTAGVRYRTLTLLPKNSVSTGVK